MLNFLKKLFFPITATLDFIQNYFKSLLFILILFLIFGSMEGESLEKPNLLRVDLNGAIFEADTFLKEIEVADSDNIKGVLVVINSPGGAVPPSIEISEAIKRLKTNKKVVVYGAGLLASGAYYSAIWADSIIANRGAIVGSIGVIFESANFEELIAKLGIKHRSITAGKYKEAGTPFREWNEYEKAQLERLINSIYDDFTQDVAQARGLDINKRDEFADAKLFSAKEALNVGLIDSIGTIKDAESEIIKLSGVANPVWSKKDKIDEFMEKIVHESVTKVFSYFNGVKSELKGF